MVYCLNYLDSPFVHRKRKMGGMRLMIFRDNAVVRQYHGHQEGHRPQRGRLSMAEQHVLFRCVRAWFLALDVQGKSDCGQDIWPGNTQPIGSCSFCLLRNILPFASSCGERCFAAWQPPRITRERLPCASSLVSLKQL